MASFPSPNGAAAKARHKALFLERQYAATLDADLLVKAAEHRLVAGDAELAEMQLDGLIALSEHDPSRVAPWTLERVRRLLAELHQPRI